jgi:hypothetical protein
MEKLPLKDTNLFSLKGVVALRLIVGMDLIMNRMFFTGMHGDNLLDNQIHCR